MDISNINYEEKEGVTEDNVTEVNTPIYKIKYKITDTDEDLIMEPRSVIDLYSLSNLFDIPNHILYIKMFKIDPAYRGVGVGSKILKQLCDEHQDKLILLEARPLEYSLESPSETQVLEYVERVERFFENVGFVNISNRVGYSKHKKSLIYNNELGSRFIQEVKL